MRKAKISTVAVIAIFSSLAAATPAHAASGLCDPDNATFSGWFARTFGYCRGSMDA